MKAGWASGKRGCQQQDLRRHLRAVQLEQEEETTFNPQGGTEVIIVSILGQLVAGSGAFNIAEPEKLCIKKNDKFLF